MSQVDPRWSLDALLQDYHPHERWRPWFAETYAKAIESGRPNEQLEGWRAAAIIFGDMHLPVFCLFVSHHGRSLEPPESTRFLGNIDLCLMEMGLAIAAPKYKGSIPVVDIGKPETFQRDTEAAREWLEEQLRPFGGSVERAAVFAMRYTAVYFGLLRGPSAPSIAQVLDESLWERKECETPRAASVEPAREPPQALAGRAETAGEILASSRQASKRGASVAISVFLLVAHAGIGLYLAAGLRARHLLFSLYYVSLGGLIMYWVDCDQPRHRERSVLDIDLFVFWPFALPRYLLSSRGLRRGLAVVGLFVVAYLVACSISVAVFYLSRPVP